MRVITVASRRAAMRAMSRLRFINTSDLRMIGCSELKIKNSQSKSSGLENRCPI